MFAKEHADANNLYFNSLPRWLGNTFIYVWDSCREYKKSKPCAILCIGRGPSLLYRIGGCVKGLYEELLISRLLCNGGTGARLANAHRVLFFFHQNCAWIKTMKCFLASSIKKCTRMLLGHKFFETWPSFLFANRLKVTMVLFDIVELEHEI